MTENLTLDAPEALELGVIEYLVPDLESLLAELSGKSWDVLYSEPR